MTDQRATAALSDYPAPTFPSDATMFFGIGAQKAGTSWLHDYLSRSDEVHFSRNKELHYFDVSAGHGEPLLKMRVNAMHILADKLDPEKRHLNTSVVERLRNAADLLSIYTGKGTGADRHDPYLAYLLAGRSNQPVVGDITPAYAILSPNDFSDMASVGHARFILILRDPVSRMWSQVRMAVDVASNADISADERKRLCIERALMLRDIGRLPNIERANYARTIKNLEAAVPASRILYVFHEDLFTGPATRQICDFLGIRHYPPETEKRVNEGVSVPLPDDIRAMFREAFAPQYDAMRARFGDRLPAAWMD